MLNPGGGCKGVYRLNIPRCNAITAGAIVFSILLEATSVLFVSIKRPFLSLKIEFDLYNIAKSNTEVNN
jgi:hypothetical protein